MIPRVTEILLTQDLEGAEYVILGDDEIDARSIEVEERCLSVLALQAPVASDLRQVVSALSWHPRSSDPPTSASTSARRRGASTATTLDPKLRGIIQKMGEQAQMLFKEATEAYLANDGVRAAALDDMDSYLDSLQREFIQQIFESHAAGTHRSAGRRATGGRRPVLRAHRRSRGEHRREGAVRRDGWMPEHVGAAASPPVRGRPRKSTLSRRRIDVGS